MTWDTVSSSSCYCWLYRAFPYFAAHNKINLILVLTAWWCPCVELSFVCWKSVFVMISVFSWQNSVSLCTPRSNLPVTPGVSWLPNFAFQSLWWKGHFLGVLVLEGHVGLYWIIQLQLHWQFWLGHRLGLLLYWMVRLGNKQGSLCLFWDCTQVLQFGIFHWLSGLLHFFYGILAYSGRYTCPLN